MRQCQPVSSIVVVPARIPCSVCEYPSLTRIIEGPIRYSPFGIPAAIVQSLMPTSFDEVLQRQARSTLRELMWRPSIISSTVTRSSVRAIHGNPICR